MRARGRYLFIVVGAWIKTLSLSLVAAACWNIYTSRGERAFSRPFVCVLLSSLATGEKGDTYSPAGEEFLLLYMRAISRSNWLDDNRAHHQSLFGRFEKSDKKKNEKGEEALMLPSNASIKKITLFLPSRRNFLPLNYVGLPVKSITDSWKKKKKALKSLTPHSIREKEETRQNTN